MIVELRRDEPATLAENWQLWSDYRLFMQRRGLSDATIRNRRVFLMALITWVGQRRILDMDVDDVEAFLARRPLTPRTRYNYLSELSAIFTWAQRTGLVDADPTRRIIRPRLGRTLPRPIRDADLRDALAVARPKMRAQLALAAYQGLRCCEIAGLDREDVLDHLDPPMLLVRHGKGGRERILPLNEHVAAALRCLPMPRSGPLFPSIPGFGRERMAANSVSRAISDFMREVMNIDASAHQLRHWFGSRVYAETNDLRLTQELLGHAHPNTTAIYAAWNPAKAVDVVRRLDVAPKSEDHTPAA